MKYSFSLRLAIIYFTKLNINSGGRTSKCKISVHLYLHDCIDATELLEHLKTTTNCKGQQNRLRWDTLSQPGPTACKHTHTHSDSGHMAPCSVCWIPVNKHDTIRNTHYLLTSKLAPLKYHCNYYHHHSLSSLSSPTQWLGIRVATCMLNIYI